jgi:hypothetical protein
MGISFACFRSHDGGEAEGFIATAPVEPTQTPIRSMKHLNTAVTSAVISSSSFLFCALFIAASAFDLE